MFDFMCLVVADLACVWTLTRFAEFLPLTKLCLEFIHFEDLQFEQLVVIFNQLVSFIVSLRVGELENRNSDNLTVPVNFDYILCK